MQNPPQKSDGDQVSWWFKFLTRGVGTVGGLVAMILGLVTCLTFHAMCLVGGVLLIFIGFIVILFEAPCCCTFIEFADKIGVFAERRPSWQKAAGYLVLSIIPVICCQGVATILGSGLVLVTGALYGLMAIGKKGDRDSMLATARRSDDVEMKAQLIDNEEVVDLHVPGSQGK